MARERKVEKHLIQRCLPFHPAPALLLHCRVYLDLVKHHEAAADVSAWGAASVLSFISLNDKHEHANLIYEMILNTHVCTYSVRA